MTLIEGIGDEVIHFFILLATVFIAIIAWWSTNISDRPVMRTVLILERRTARHTPIDGQPALADLRDSSELPPQISQSEVESKTSQSDNEANSQIEVNTTEHYENIVENKNELERSTPTNEDSKSSSVEEDRESVTVRNRNLTLLASKEELSENDEISTHNRSPGCMGDESSSSNELYSTNEGNIRIRLKYLNDDQKLVEGKLQEQLGDFKRRHFSLELSGRKLVRLIFNGKVLQQDSRTLQNYGFFDNCVVHCLVHQPRTPPPSPNLNRTREGQAQNETHHHWDLGNILFASLSFLLGLAWYGRYQYAQLYTATTTVVLIGLTGMFTVSLIGMYMPDVDGVRT